MYSLFSIYSINCHAVYFFKLLEGSCIYYNYCAKLHIFKYVGACGLTTALYVSVSLSFAYRLYEKLTGMYESGSTRRFKAGRTDTIRSVSAASLKFVQAMSDPSASVSLIPKHSLHEYWHGVLHVITVVYNKNTALRPKACNSSFILKVFAFPTCYLPTPSLYSAVSLPPSLPLCSTISPLASPFLTLSPLFSSTLLLLQAEERLRFLQAAVQRHTEYTNDVCSIDVHSCFIEIICVGVGFAVTCIYGCITALICVGVGLAAI